MQTTSTWNVAALLGAVLVTGVAPAFAGTSIVMLNSYGGPNSHAWAVNSSGQVTGQADTPNALVGYLSDRTGHMVDMGDLGAGATQGLGINDAGAVTGSSTVYYDSNIGGYVAHAFVYQSGVMFDLGAFDPEGSSAGASINSSGQVTGYSYAPGWLDSPYNLTHAFLYTGTPGNGVMHDLGSLPGSSVSAGTGINSAGTVTGVAIFDDTGISHAFIYSGTPGSGGKMTDLGVAPGATQSVSTAINASGQVTGYVQIRINGVGPRYQAMLYTGTPGVDGKMVDLGGLGGTTNPTSFGYAINDAGDVVGQAGTFDVPGLTTLTGESVGHAFLYLGTPGVDGHMIDLNAWFDSVDPTDGAMWDLTTAYGINNEGLIVGEGYYGPVLYDYFNNPYREIRGFILDASALTATTVPEPGLLGLLAMATPLVLRRRR